MNLKDYLTYYLLYVFNYIPEWMIFENWNKDAVSKIQA